MELASELDRVGLDVQRTGLDPALLVHHVVQSMPSPSTPEGLLSPIFSPTSQLSFPFVPFFIPNSIAPLLDQGQRRLIDAVQHVMGIDDAISKVYYQLFEAKHWWILENIPTLTVCQEPTGDWTRKRMWSVIQLFHLEVTDVLFKIQTKLWSRTLHSLLY